MPRIPCGLKGEWNQVNHGGLDVNPLLYYLICVDSKVDWISMDAWTPLAPGRPANYNLSYLPW